MAETSTVAKPYSQAVFKLAQEKGQLSEWSEGLANIATIVSNKDMANLIASPKCDDDMLSTLIIDLCGEGVSQELKNFVRLIIENDRVKAIPAINDQFQALKAEAEATVDAQIISAFEVSDAQQAKVAEALKAKLGKNVNISVKIDESVVGGAIIRAGDLVIDGSVVGKLEKLGHTLNH